MSRLLLGLCLCFAAASPGLAQMEKLTWAPPALENPITIKITNENSKTKLDLSRDYILEMPDTPLTSVGGLVISGGRNVVLIGGEILIDHPPVEGRTPLDRRAVYVNRSTGTVHIEGLLIRGEHAAEGFNIDMREPNAVLQIQNVRVENLQGTRAGHHADVVQTWAGPSELRIDRLTGISQYQGMFLHPRQFHKEGEIKLFDFRRVNLKAGAYIYWQATPFPIKLEEVYAEPHNPERADDLIFWPKGDPVWSPVTRGAPPQGDFVPEGVAGIGYVSPGYLSPGRVEATAAE